MADEPEELLDAYGEDDASQPGHDEPAAPEDQLPIEGEPGDQESGAEEEALDLAPGYVERNEEANAAALAAGEGEEQLSKPAHDRGLVLGRDLLPTTEDAAREAEFAALRAAGMMAPASGAAGEWQAGPGPEGVDLDLTPEAAPPPPVAPPPEMEFAFPVTEIPHLRFVDANGNGYYLDESRAGEYQLRRFWLNPTPPRG